MQRTKRINLWLSQKELWLLQLTSLEQSVNQMNFIRKLILLEGIKSVGALTGEESNRRIKLIEDIESEVEERRELRRENAHRYWDIKTGKSRVDRLYDQYKHRRKYQSTWEANKRAAAKKEIENINKEIDSERDQRRG